MEINEKLIGQLQTSKTNQYVKQKIESLALDEKLEGLLFKTKENPTTIKKPKEPFDNFLKNLQSSENFRKNSIFKNLPLRNFNLKQTNNSFFCDININKNSQNDFEKVSFLSKTKSPISLDLKIKKVENCLICPKPSISRYNIHPHNLKKRSFNELNLFHQSFNELELNSNQSSKENENRTFKSRLCAKSKIQSNSSDLKNSKINYIEDTKTQSGFKRVKSVNGEDTKVIPIAKFGPESLDNDQDLFLNKKSFENCPLKFFSNRNLKVKFERMLSDLKKFEERTDLNQSVKNDLKLLIQKHSIQFNELSKERKSSNQMITF